MIDTLKLDTINSEGKLIIIRTYIPIKGEANFKDNDLLSQAKGTLEDIELLPDGYEVILVLIPMDMTIKQIIVEKANDRQLIAIPIPNPFNLSSMQHDIAYQLAVLNLKPFAIGLLGIYTSVQASNTRKALYIKSGTNNISDFSDCYKENYGLDAPKAA